MMPLLGEAKKLWDRNNHRTMRYGNWRQIYYNAMGICEVCEEAIDDLEIHEKTDGISVVEWHLVCVDCHLKVVHKDSPTEWIRRKYGSQLAQDINNEIIESGGTENWKRKFFIKDGQTNGDGLDIYKFSG